MVNASNRTPSPPPPQLPTAAELDAYHAAQAPLRAAAMQQEYLRQVAVCVRNTRPHMKTRVASLKNFARILIHIDDLTPYQLQGTQIAPPVPVGTGWYIYAYIWRPGSDSPFSVAQRDGYIFEAHVDRATHDWPDPRLAEDWLTVWELTEEAKTAVPPIAALNQPGLSRPVRWETDSERFERALREYRELIGRCPRRNIKIKHKPYADKSRVYECVLGWPCNTCKSHPGAPWYQMGEKWSNQFDADAPSPPASPSARPLRLEPAFDFINAFETPARLPTLPSNAVTVRTGPRPPPIRAPGFDASSSDDDY